MSLTLRKRGQKWYFRGTVRLICGTVIQVNERSTGCSDESDAHDFVKRYERKLSKPEDDTTVGDAIFAYTNSGKSERFMGPLTEAFAAAPIADLSHDIVAFKARWYFPNAARATLQRQWYGPLNAVLNFHERTMANFQRLPYYRVFRFGFDGLTGNSAESFVQHDKDMINR